MAEAQRADIGGGKCKVKIGEPVANGMGAAEGKDCECECVVDGYVACHARE